MPDLSALPLTARAQIVIRPAEATRLPVSGQPPGSFPDAGSLLVEARWRRTAGSRSIKSCETFRDGLTLDDRTHSPDDLAYAPSPPKFASPEDTRRAVGGGTGVQRQVEGCPMSALHDSRSITAWSARPLTLRVRTGSTRGSARVRRGSPRTCPAGTWCRSPAGYHRHR